MKKETEGSAELFVLDGATDIDADVLLELARQKWNLEEVVVAGMNRDGEFVFGSSRGTKRDVLYLLTLAIRNLGL